MGTVFTVSLNTNSRERVAVQNKGRRNSKWLAVLSILFLSLAELSAQNTPVSFTFTIAQKSTTSAGIYRRNGALIKTLWNNVSYPAGTHTAYWDRTNDEGNLLTDSGYIVKVVSANVNYTWEGVIGNNSDSLTGSTKIRAFERFHSIAFAGNYGYFGIGYTEGVPSCYKFNINSPNSKINILFADNGDIDQECHYVATDGTNVYWAGFDPYNISLNFVYATKTSDDKEYAFRNGTSTSTTYGRTYSSAIDVYNNSSAAPSGLAVQKNGQYLFVAHKDLNLINVLNKTTGALVQTLTFTRPREICMDAADNLWVIHGTNSIQKFTVNSNGTLSTATLSISGVTEPLAMAVSPNNTKLVVLDGAASQQAKAFSNITGTLIWTLGTAGGYINSPAVNDNKFYFNDSTTQLTKTFISFQADSSFWIGDVGNERVQHYSASRTFINRIMCLPASYSTVADRNNPTRVFNQFLEFKIDYSKPLKPNNGSWTLANNWRRSIPSNYYQSDMLRVFKQMITLSNGRTYAILDRFNNGIREPEIVELPPSGNLRFTGIFLDDFAVDIINPDGSIRRLVTDRNLGDSGYFEVQALTGFTNRNNPIWGPKVKTAYLPTITSTDPAYSNVGSAAVTTSGYNLVFNAEKDNTGYHLGAVKTGTKGYIWKTSKATFKNYTGPHPTDGSFDIGNNVEYPGGDVYAVDRNIFWNHHGEFWKNSQTNYWNHYLDNGLMVGQFGINCLEGEAVEHEAYAKGAGNVFSSTIVKVGSDYYVYHNDESVHGGIHRWKITGLNTIAEQTISLTFAPAVAGGLSGNYFDGTDLNNFKLRTSQVNTTVNLSTPPSLITNSASFSTRWTGYVKAGSSQAYTFYTNTSKGVRLWINGNLVIDRWTNGTLTEYRTAAINLTSGVLYSVRMEINGGTATLSWSSSSTAKQIIPTTNLYPDAFPDYSKSYDLMEGLAGTGVLQDNFYGWTRNSTSEVNNAYDDYWNVIANIKSHVASEPSLSMRFRRYGYSYNVSRDLGPSISCLQNWTISGGILFEHDYPIIDNTGAGYFDVLDDQGKIISRITHEMTYISQNNRPTQIKINGKNVMSVHEPYLYADLNKINDFSISMANKTITFKYGNYAAVTTKMYDTTANWNKPKTIRFSFFGGDYDRAFDVRNMKFTPTAGQVPVVTNSGNNVLCQGSSVTLSAPSGQSYLWSTGAGTQSINVSTAGSYSVTVNYGNGCSMTSALTIIKVNPLPIPVITVNGVGLKSNYVNGNQWYLNGIAIPGATKQTFTVIRAGVYSLSVTDSFGCKGSATIAVPLPFKDVKISSKCLDDNTIEIEWLTMESDDEYHYGIEYSDDNGQTWNRLTEIKADRSSIGSIYHTYKTLANAPKTAQTIFRWYSLDINFERVQSIAFNTESCRTNKIVAYPNPFSGNIQLGITEGVSNYRTLVFEVLDMQGKVIYTEDISTDNGLTEGTVIAIDGLDFLSQGFYQVRLSSEDIVLLTQKMLKIN